jgi:hypothetical protein
MDEWQPLKWNTLPGITFAFSLAVIVLTQCLAKLRRVGGISIGHALLLVCFGVQVIFLERMLPWWAILCPLVCVGPWARLLKMPKSDASIGVMGRAVQAVLILTMMWIGFAWSPLGAIFIDEEVSKLGQTLHPGTPRVMARGFLAKPVPGVDPAIAAALQRPGKQVFSSETLGDYLFFSRIPVLVFTHVHLFSPEHWRRCLAVKRGDPEWEKILNEWNAWSVCVEAELHPQLCELIRRSPRWQIVVDEAGSSTKPNPKSRLFIAIRK